MVSLVMAAAVLIQSAGGAAIDAKCPASAPTAVVRGHTVCIAESADCRVRLQRAYRRFGMRCAQGRLVYDWLALRRRQLRVPQLGEGATCAATSVRTAPAGPVVGSGPAYPSLTGAATAELRLVWGASDLPYLGWYGGKAPWAIPAYEGAVLVRGRRIDGMGDVGFDLGPRWTRKVATELRLTGPQETRPAAMFVRDAGCYGLQIDTAKRTYVIVFRAIMDG